MFHAFVFHQDPTSKKYVARRTGASTQDLSTAIRMVERAKKEGYVILLGRKRPVWNNVERTTKQQSALSNR